MGTINTETLKLAVRDHWNAQACGTQDVRESKFSRAYFDAIEEQRYEIEPYIFSFAQFTRHHGDKVLEVGVGAGTDFVQWVRAGAQAHGVDLTQEAIDHVRHRLQVYGLQACDFQVADCENLPFPDDMFDVVYSWGVIHHTPNTAMAFAEIVRVLRPGGTAKVMIYHRHSLVGLYEWLKWALLKGRPWHSVSWCFDHCVESPGTKAFT
ncbi:MAG: class I SAM-dependent methyltransferase [Terriglobales bacterium]